MSDNKSTVMSDVLDGAKEVLMAATITGVSVFCMSLGFNTVTNLFSAIKDKASK